MLKQVVIEVTALVTVDLDIKENYNGDIGTKVKTFIDNEVVIDTVYQPIVDSDIIGHRIVTISDIQPTTNELVERVLNRCNVSEKNSPIEQLIRLIPSKTLKAYLDS